MSRKRTDREEDVVGRRSWFRDLQEDQRRSGVIHRLDGAAIPPVADAPPTPTPSASGGAVVGGNFALAAGVYATVVTPFASNGTVDIGAVGAYATALRSDGVVGVIVAHPVMGEGTSLTVEEYKALIDAWVATGLTVLACVDAPAWPTMVELARYATAPRVAAIVVGGGLTNVQAQASLLQELSRYVVGTPILLRYTPTTETCFATISAILQRNVPLRGFLFESSDLVDFAACLPRIGGTAVFANESAAVGAVALGATALGGEGLSVVAPLIRRLIDAKGDVAASRKFQTLLARFETVLHDACEASAIPRVVVLRALVALRLDRSIGAPRLPLPNLTLEQATKTQDDFHAFVQAYISAVAPKTPPALDTLPGWRGELKTAIIARVRACEAAIGEPILSKLPHLNREWKRVRRPITDVAKFIDHTILKPEATTAEIITLCDEALKYKFAAVCVNGSRVEMCAMRLHGTGVKVAAVIGFPLGAMTTASKARETSQLVRLGAAEIDMVLNVGLLKEGQLRAVFEDIRAVVEAAGSSIVKVIFETCLLNTEQIMDAAILSVAAGAAFVKTSTGFNKGGATPEALDIMLATVGASAEVKASGGVRDADTAQAYVVCGVDRIGTSSGVAIVSRRVATSAY